jgi:hypothetical protein
MLSTVQWPCCVRSNSLDPSENTGDEFCKDRGYEWDHESKEPPRKIDLGPNKELLQRMIVLDTMIIPCLNCQRHKLAKLALTKATDSGACK